ncbi:hypothetical protein SDC9_49370 [bioreactor metagenome]|uniref:Novel STAND NTPase 1 domain-containing protein n=1 Tax=bioreactor metagenome TaxID=1076179 RepID=A0A644WH69_9ZZZZ
MIFIYDMGKIDEKLDIIGRAFTPSTPINETDFFYGRKNQLEQIVNSINLEGQHAILYGERGVGKTSLANIMTFKITNIYPIKITCNRQDDFKSIWIRVFDSIPVSHKTDGIGFKPPEKKSVINLGSAIKQYSEVKPSDIESLIKKLPRYNYLFIFDEFDNTKKKVKDSFADLIKSLSDNLSYVTLVFVGIADNVEELIGSHQSIERCLKQIKMPVMSNQECAMIIDSGFKKVGITIDPIVREKIIEFASGYAHYVHLLCYFGAKELIENKRSYFNQAYLSIAINKGIENVNEQIRSSYQKAITDSKSNAKWLSVLNACAHAKTDQFNCFKISDVSNEYNRNKVSPIKSNYITYNINQLCKKERGEILKKIGTGVNTRFRFINPLMRAFVKLKMHTV